MLKKIVIFLALVVCIVCFGYELNFTTLAKPPKEIDLFDYKDGDVAYTPLKKTLITTDNNLKIMVFPFIGRYSGKYNFQIRIANTTGNIAKLSIRRTNGNKFDLKLRPVPYFQETVNGNLLYFSCFEISQEQYIEYFVKEIPASVLFQFPNDSKLYNIPIGLWKESFETVAKSLFNKKLNASDNEVQVQFR
ncbi:MAG: hypothetical protein J6R06_00250 [Bacteroidales bacterium]|nr:hypothetical protein [Bacteroidales bacterium]